MDKIANPFNAHLIGSSLKMSEGTLRLLFKSIPIPTFVWQKQDQDFILVDYNDAADSLTDGKIIHLLGKKVEELTNQNPEIKQELWQCLNEKTVIERQRSYKLQTTGETRHFSSKYVFFPPDLVLTFSEDKTFLEETTLKLKDSTNRYQELANLLPQTIFETDSNHNVTYSNRAGFKAFGYSEEDLKQGLNIFDLIVPEEREKITKNIANIYTSSRTEGHEYSAVRKDGTTFAVTVYSAPIIRNGKFAGLRGILIDDSKLKAAQQALVQMNKELEQRVRDRTASLVEANAFLRKEIARHRRTQQILKQNEEKYRAVVEQSAECVFLVDLDTKCIIEANPAFQRLLGYSADEVKKLQIYDFTAHDREDIDQKIKLIQETESVFLSQIKYRDKNGKLIDIESSASLIRYQNRKVICVVARDVSIRIRAENIRQTIYEIAQSISHAKNLSELVRSIRQILGNLIDTRCFYLFLYDDNDNSISVPYWINELQNASPCDFNEMLVRQIIAEGRSILINADDPNNKLDNFKKFALSESHIRSWLGVPLNLEDRVFGAIVILSYETDNQFTNSDLELLEMVSHHMGLAIAHKKAEEELITAHQIYRAAIENAQGVPYKLTYSKNAYDILGKGIKELIGLETNEITCDRLRGLKQQIIVHDQKYFGKPLEYSQAFRRGEISKYQTDFMIITFKGQKKVDQRLCCAHQRSCYWQRHWFVRNLARYHRTQTDRRSFESQRGALSPCRRRSNRADLPLSP